MSELYFAFFVPYDAHGETNIHLLNCRCIVSAVPIMITSPISFNVLTITSLSNGDDLTQGWDALQMLLSSLVQIVKKFSSFKSKIAILTDLTLYIHCFCGCEVVPIRIVKKFSSFPIRKDPTLYGNCFCGCTVAPIIIHALILAAWQCFMMSQTLGRQECLIPKIARRVMLGPLGISQSSIMVSFHFFNNII